MTSTTGRLETLPSQAVAALWRGQTIEAIKIIRLDRSVGLKEAKDQVDAYVRSQPALKKKMEEHQSRSLRGLLRWILLLGVIAAGIAYAVIEGR